MHAALDAGITFFDTADIYGDRGGSETLLGQALGTRRKDVVLVTKFGLPMDDGGRRQGGARRYVLAAAEASLRRLSTDWIDVYYYHRPDPKTPIEETLGALDDLVRAGKVRHIGCSNFSAAQIDAAQEVARRRPCPPSSPRRTSTACWRAGSSAISCRRSNGTGSRCCPISRSPAAC